MSTSLLPSTASAEPGPSLLGLRLAGEDCGLFKLVYGAAQTPYLFGPVRLTGEGSTPSMLFPHEVTVFGDDEGLKARHLTPGEKYTHPGRHPTNNVVTCHFTGESHEIGSLEVVIIGVIRGQ